MKRVHVSSIATASLCLWLTGLVGCLCIMPEHISGAPDVNIQLAPDFVPQEQDFESGGKNGNFMGIGGFRGRLLKAIDGVHPIYLVKAKQGRFANDPMAVGDIIVGLQGKALGPDQVRAFKRAVATAKRREKPLVFTRWRNGVAEPVSIDLQVCPPDLTAGGVIDDLHDWQLGPTGLNGWIFSRSQRDGASHDARQIMVTYIEPDSPADGKVKLGDVIVGIAGTRFSYDARKAFANAIENAECERNKGVLNLRIWRPSTEQRRQHSAAGGAVSGERMDVPITLKTLPETSATSPYNCPRTDAIIDAACDFLKQKELTADWIGYINGLGMLASGREDLIPKLKTFAHDLCIPGEVLSIQKHTTMLCWQWSYKLLFLAEYYLKTGDKYVFPTIKEYATKLAMGQSGVGTWGHTVAAIENEGHLHGRLGGYGAINQQGLTVMLGLSLAQKGGVDNEEIRNAIRKGNTFFSYYIDKGTIPYGDHSPNTQWYDDNGKSGSAAVMYDFMGQPDGATFFSSMVLGSSPSGREAGHTGCFWSHLWGGVGAARAGKRATQAFVNQMNWSYTLERGCKGNFVFQGNAGEAGKSGMSKDKAWDCTGARLLQLCLPRKEIYLTGRGMKIRNPLTPNQIANILRNGELYTNKAARKQLSKSAIIQLLSDKLPAVRMIGVKAIGEQELQMVDDLIAMLDSDNRYARYGACYALSENGYRSEKAVKKLIGLIEHSDDLDLKLNALGALTSRDVERSLTPVSKRAIPVLLKLCVKRFDIDPRRLLQRRLAFVLFERNGLISFHGIDDIDSSLLVPAIRELLTVDDGRARGAVSSVYKNLNDADRKALWGDILVATREVAPSGIMFADQPRINGLKLMMEQGVAEGVELALDIMSEQRWGAKGRKNAALEILKGYGSAAKKALPILKKMRNRTNLEPDQIEQIDAAIKAIESGEPMPLKSIAKYLK